jgi:hypothetical protein
MPERIVHALEVLNENQASELDRLVRERDAVAEELQKLTAQKEALTSDIKGLMTESGESKVLTSDYTVTLLTMTRGTLDKGKLVELGVRQEVIDEATKKTTSVQLRVTKKKVG